MLLAPLCIVMRDSRPHNPFASPLDLDDLLVRGLRARLRLRHVCRLFGPASCPRAPRAFSKNISRALCSRLPYGRRLNSSSQPFWPVSAASVLGTRPLADSISHSILVQCVFVIFFFLSLKKLYFFLPTTCCRREFLCARARLVWEREPFFLLRVSNSDGLGVSWLPASAACSMKVEHEASSNLLVKSRW